MSFGPKPSSIWWVPEAICFWIHGWSVRLTSHLCQVLSSKRTGAMSLLSPCTFMQCTGTVLTLPQKIILWLDLS